MTDPRYLTWEQLKLQCDDGAPRTFALAGSPPLRLMVEGHLSGLRLLIPWNSESTKPIVRFATIEIREVLIDGQHMLAVGSSDHRLMRECYAFLMSVADSIQLHKRDVANALREALDGWSRLLDEISALSVDRQVGLLGELWVATRLVRAGRTDAFRSWLGPTGEPHDFRLSEVELEVKSTRTAVRRHSISSLSQLVPSQGHNLQLISLQLEPSGTAAGKSLPEAILVLKDDLGASAETLLLFDQHLAAVGYHSQHAGLYATRFRLRTPPVSIDVSRELPVLSQALIQQQYGAEVAVRLEEVQYVINVEGLGFAEDSSQFQALLPRPANGDLF